jgi:tRNA A58 N-methylase Trm61
MTLPRYSIWLKTNHGTGQPMSIMRNTLMDAFGRPQGLLGRLGGIIMARTNEGCGAWVTDLLKVRPNDNVLEVGFGPGVIIQRLSKLAPAGHIAGIDPSLEMVEQARARNATAIQNGRVDLHRRSRPDRGSGNVGPHSRGTPQ